MPHDLTDYLQYFSLNKISIINEYILEEFLYYRPNHDGTFNSRYVRHYMEKRDQWEYDGEILRHLSSEGIFTFFKQEGKTIYQGDNKINRYELHWTAWVAVDPTALAYDITKIFRILRYLKQNIDELNQTSLLDLI